MRLKQFHSKLLLSSSLSCRSRRLQRAFSGSAVRYDGDNSIALSPKWLSDTKARIGKCITFGMSSELVDAAGRTLTEISRDWRDLIAGTQGYLTDPRRAGLHRFSIAWGDQDAMGHVNNVMYVRYAESGRTNWTRKIGQHFDTPNQHLWADMLSAKNIGLILKSIAVDFKFPMTWPDRISVYHKLRSEPNEATESILLDVLIVSEGKQRAAAKCLEDVVVYDYQLGRKTALPPFMLKQFKQIWEVQETVKRDCMTKMETIETQVRYLEQQSWDKAGAKEDFGGAAHPP